MPSWSAFAAAAPELATTVRARLDAHPYKLLATLRKDGSPRVSGIEVEFLDDGELRAGSTPDSVKVRDLDRDGRFALHNTPAPEVEWAGDASRRRAPDHRAARRRALLPPRPTRGRDGRNRRHRAGLSVWTPEGGVRSWTR